MKSLERISYVEDDADVAAIAKMALEEIGGFDVQICSSGAEAVEAVPRFGPDLILLDVMMPAMDGPTTFKKLRTRSNLADTPIIFMTATAQQNEVEKYLALGAAGFIAKPFDPIELPQLVRTAWTTALEGAAA